MRVLLPKWIVKRVAARALVEHTSPENLLSSSLESCTLSKDPHIDCYAPPLLPVEVRDEAWELAREKAARLGVDPRLYACWCAFWAGRFYALSYPLLRDVYKVYAGMAGRSGGEGSFRIWVDRYVRPLLDLVVEREGLGVPGGGR